MNALLALAGGGFGVQVVTGHSSHLVGVTTGLYCNTLVQVSGPGMTTGGAGGGAVVVTQPVPVPVPAAAARPARRAGARAGRGGQGVSR